jgi:hypothetical protein
MQGPSYARGITFQAQLSALFNIAVSDDTYFVWAAFDVY